MVNIAWLLDEASFINVAAVVLLQPPLSNKATICSDVDDSSSVSP